MQRHTLVLVVAVAVVVAGTGIAVAQLAGYDAWWHVTAGGGGRSTGSSGAVEGTLGQPVVEVSTGRSFRVESGFWPGLVSMATPTATRTRRPGVTDTATPTSNATPTATRTRRPGVTDTATATRSATPASTGTGTPTATTGPTKTEVYLPAVLDNWSMSIW
jgi:hypothetical protein